MRSYAMKDSETQKAAMKNLFLTMQGQNFFWLAPKLKGVGCYISILNVHILAAIK